MKLSLFLLASAFLTLSAQAGEYEERIFDAALLDCKSVFEHRERVIVSTTKTNTVGRAEYESIKSLDVYAQVQLGTIAAKRKYVINSVQLDIVSDDEYSSGVYPRPMIVSGKHPKTGEKIRVEINQEDTSEGDLEYQNSKLYIGGKEQDYLKLQCRVVFAG